MPFTTLIDERKKYIIISIDTGKPLMKVSIHLRQKEFIAKWQQNETLNKVNL